MLSNISNLNIGILGLKRSGISTFNTLSKTVKNLYCWDDNQEVRMKLSSIKDLTLKPINEWNDLNYIIVSPGIPKDHPVFKIESKIICDIELFYLMKPDKFYISITGTNGKSTTTALIHHILSYNTNDFAVAGNIGFPIFNTRDVRNYVLELSSFQLDLMDQFKTDIGVLINISPDHIDRHKNLDNYINAKLRIFKDAKIKIIGVDDAYSNKIYEEMKKDSNIIPISSTKILKHGISVINNEIIINGEKRETINPILKGEHNAQNIAASYACCSIFYDLISS